MKSTKSPVEKLYVKLAEVPDPLLKFTSNSVVIPFSVIGAYFVMRRTWPGRKLLLSLIWGIPLLVLVAGL